MLVSKENYQGQTILTCFSFRSCVVVMISYDFEVDTSMSILERVEDVLRVSYQENKTSESL